MSLSEEDIKRLAIEISKLNSICSPSEKEPVYCAKWVKLRKEIDKWIKDHMSLYSYSYGTMNQQIYGAIKFVTGCRFLKDMTDEQADGARLIFEQMKSGYEKYGGQQYAKA